MQMDGHTQTHTHTSQVSSTRYVGMPVLHADWLIRFPVGRRPEGKAHSNNKMEVVEGSLAGEKNVYKHLYDVMDKCYKKQALTAHSWRGIGKTLEEVAK